MEILLSLLSSKILSKVLLALTDKLEELSHKVTRAGKPYSIDWVKDLQLVAESTGKEGISQLLENFLVLMRNYTPENPASIHQIVGSLLPREITKVETNRESRMAQWVSILCSVLTDMNILKESDVKLDSNGGYQAMDGYYINWNVLKGMIPEGNASMIRDVRSKPRATNKTLGSLWAKGGDVLDHCSDILWLQNSTPITFNKRVMELLGREFHLSPAKESKWDRLAFDTFEDYQMARQQAFDSYISKLASYVNDVADTRAVVYNTYAPDTRGRLYPTNDVGNFIGIKQVRACVQFSEGEYIDSSDDDL